MWLNRPQGVQSWECVGQYKDLAEDFELENHDVR